MGFSVHCGAASRGFLIDKFNYTTAFQAAFLLQVAALVPMLLSKRSDLPSVVMENKAFSEQRWEPRNLMAAWLTYGITGAILEVVFSLFSAYVSLLGFSVIWAGFFILELNVSRAATFLGVGFFMERVGERKFMLLGMILAVSVTILGLTSNVELLTVTLLVLGLACGMTQASALTLVSRSPLRARGSAIGKLEFSFYLSFALTSQLGGISADFLGLSSPYIISGVVAIVGLIDLLTLMFKGLGVNVSC